MPHGMIDYVPYNTGQCYTESEILRAIALKASGLTWPQVGKKLGRSPVSLNSCVSRYRRGQVSFTRAQRETIVDEVVQEVVRGVSIKEAARRRGLNLRGLHNSLRYRGWDAETLGEFKEAQGL